MSSWQPKTTLRRSAKLGRPTFANPRFHFGDDFLWRATAAINCNRVRGRNHRTGVPLGIASIALILGLDYFFHRDLDTTPKKVFVSSLRPLYAIRNQEKFS